MRCGMKRLPAGAPCDGHCDLPAKARAAIRTELAVAKFVVAECRDLAKPLDPTARSPETLAALASDLEVLADCLDTLAGLLAGVGE